MDDVANLIFRLIFTGSSGSSSSQLSDPELRILEDNYIITCSNCRSVKVMKNHVSFTSSFSTYFLCGFRKVFHGNALLAASGFNNFIASN